MAVIKVNGKGLGLDYLDKDGPYRRDATIPLIPYLNVQHESLREPLNLIKFVFDTTTNKFDNKKKLERLHSVSARTKETKEPGVAYRIRINHALRASSPWRTLVISTFLLCPRSGSITKESCGVGLLPSRTRMIDFR